LEVCDALSHRIKLCQFMDNIRIRSFVHCYHLRNWGCELLLPSLSWRIDTVPTYSSRSGALPVRSLIGSIYSVNRFTQAFPEGIPFFPEDASTYESNLSVTPQEVGKRSGAPRTRRIPSSGELNPRRKARVDSIQQQYESACSAFSSERIKKKFGQAYRFWRDFPRHCRQKCWGRSPTIYPCVWRFNYWTTHSSWQCTVCHHGPVLFSSSLQLLSWTTTTSL